GCRREPATGSGSRLLKTCQSACILETLASATRQKHQQLRSSSLAVLPMGSGGRFWISLADRLDNGGVITVRVDGLRPQFERLHACAVRLIATGRDDLAQPRVAREVDQQCMKGLVMARPAHEIVARQHLVHVRKDLLELT